MTSSTYTDTRLLINGEWCDAISGKTLDVINPATGQTIGKVARAGIADLDRALDAAQQGFLAWKKIPANERAITMRKAAALIRERVPAIAALLTQEQGKPLAEAKVEVMAAADIIEWFADEGRRVYGRIVPPRNLNVQQQVLKEPIGPVAAFTPWNFPINQVVRKLSGALACGCSFLVKAPEETPASPAALLQAFVDAGVPAGTGSAGRRYLGARLQPASVSPVSNAIKVLRAIMTPPAGGGRHGLPRHGCRSWSAGPA